MAFLEPFTTVYPTDPSTVVYDPYSLRTLKKQKGEAEQSPEQVAINEKSRAMEGTQAPADFLRAGQIPGQEGMNTALERRQQRQFASQNNLAERKVEAEAPTKQAGRIQSQLGMARGEYSATLDFINRQKTAQLNSEAARNQALMGLIGGIGSGAGYALGSKKTTQKTGGI